MEGGGRVGGWKGVGGWGGGRGWAGGRGWVGGRVGGGGWEGGGVGGGGGWGAVGGAKHPFGPKGQCCAFSKCHELIQSTREAQTAVRSSLVPHAVLLTHPRTMKCTLVVSQHRQKAVCKSRPGNLLSSVWCFWIVHECAYHVQAKDGFQLLCPHA